MSTYIDNIVKFHTFSKSPVHGTLGLGDAVNPSGHTVTSSQVRTDDIPWFIDTFQGNKTAALTWLAENADEARHNDIAYYGAKFKAGFDKPQCLIYVSKQEVDGKLVDLPAAQCGWQDFELKTATTLKNSEGKDVIAIHKNCAVEYVDGSNNASTNSNRWSMFVKTADGRILDHFVASTDKIHQGMPSSGYNALVLKGGAAIDEGELDNNYIGNTFAGIIHFNTQQTEGHDTNGTIKVTCYEYIGDKLDTTLTNIDNKISKVVGDAFEGAVASVTATEATKNLGLTVTEGANPEISVSPGSISESKLVTGSTVKTYVDTTALAEGGSIAEYIENYVSTNAKVSVNGQSATTITVAGTDASSSDLVKIAVAEDKDTPNEIGLTLTATVDTATVTEGVVKSGDESKLVTAGDAANIAEKAAAGVDVGVTGITINNGAKQTGDVAISVVTGTISVASGTDYPNNPYGIGIGLDDNKAYAQVQPAVYNSASKAFTSATSNYLTTASGVTAYVTDAISDAVDAIVIPTLSTNSGSIGVDAYGHTVNISTAAYTPASGETAASWTDKGYLITGATVEAFVDAEVGKVADNLTALESKVNAYHKAGVSYKVLQDLPSPSVDYNGVIVLVPSVTGTEENTDVEAAISGSYVEWLCVNKGTEEAPSWAWEQIGTTEADLHGYVNNIHSNNSSLDGSSSIYASISSTGYLNIGARHATDSVMGISKMFTGTLSTAFSNVTDTAVSVKSAQAMYSTLANLANNTIHSVFADDYLCLAGISIVDYDKNITISNTFVTKPNWWSGIISVVNGVITTKSTGKWSKLPIATSKIINGNRMFASQGDITTWADDLECLTNGYAMFASCYNLTTFIGDLGSLTNGYNMFDDCKLSLESVEFIADTINDVSELTNTTPPVNTPYEGEVNKRFDFGYDVMPDEIDALNAAIAEIKAKGWTVYANKNMV